MSRTLIITADPTQKKKEQAIFSLIESDFSGISVIDILVPECQKKRDISVPVYHEILSWRLPQVKEACRKRYDSEQDVEEYYKGFETLVSFVETRFKTTGKYSHFFVIEG